MTRPSAHLDFAKYRLRSFVERLIALGEVEIHDRPVPLTELSAIIERTDKAVPVSYTHLTLPTKA